MGIRIPRGLSQQSERNEPHMNKLNKKQSKELAKHQSDLTDAAEAIEEAVEAYATAADEARAFAESIHADQQAYYDERSEKWQEGDAGTAYTEWMELWETAENASAEYGARDCAMKDAFEELTTEIEG